MALASPQVEEVTSLEVAPDLPWQVVVSNDPVNLVSVVCRVFQHVLDLSEEKAMEYTMRVHHEGRCAVFTGSQEECQGKAEALMAHSLWTHIEKVGQEG